MYVKALESSLHNAENVDVIILPLCLSSLEMSVSQSHFHRSTMPWRPSSFRNTIMRLELYTRPFHSLLS